MSPSRSVTANRAALTSATKARRLKFSRWELAALALITFIVIYNRVSKPVNTTLTTAALADRVPADARQLQAHWDSVINARVALQTLALAGLCVALAAT